jgi:hypothetical protein
MLYLSQSKGQTIDTASRAEKVERGWEREIQDVPAGEASIL